MCFCNSGEHHRCTFCFTDHRLCAMSWHLKFDFLGDAEQVMYLPPLTQAPCHLATNCFGCFFSDSKLVSCFCVEQTADEEMWTFHECNNQEFRKFHQFSTDKLKKPEDEVNLPEHPMITFGIV